MNDILTVMWKERKGLFRYKGSRTRFLLVLLTPVLLAVVMPWQWGAEWVEEIPTVILSALIPMILVGVTIPDSFAGERERHTLETLLASRLSDRAIFFGKVAVSVALGWGVTLVVLLLSLITVNIAHWDGKLLLYPPVIAWGNLALSLLMAVLVAGMGILVSLRAETVQQAAQTLMALFVVPIILMQLAAFVIPMALPSDQIRRLIESIDGTQLMLIVLAVLALLAASIFALAMARFQRSRLALD
jgi:ABC-2 type transport system permease protein